jgi:molybdenum cofactor guanylyltransferase
MSVETRSNGLGAIVLCGGQSRRMGQAKAWLPFGNELLLQRVVRRLSDVARPVVVVRASGQTLPELPSGTLVTEDAVEHRGPLQGIVTGLGAIRHAADIAFVSSTDAPFVDPALVRLLVDLRGTSYDLVVPYAFGRHHPLAALYTMGVLAEAERMLAEKQLRVMELLGRVRTLVVDEQQLRAIDPRLLSMCNVNTPDDYEAALRKEASS